MFKCGATKVVLELAASSSCVTWCAQAARAFGVKQNSVCMIALLVRQTDTTNALLVHKQLIAADFVHHRGRSSGGSADE